MAQTIPNTKGFVPAYYDSLFKEALEAEGLPDNNTLQLKVPYYLVKFGWVKHDLTQDQLDDGFREIARKIAGDLREAHAYPCMSQTYTVVQVLDDQRTIAAKVFAFVPKAREEV